LPSGADRRRSVWFLGGNPVARSGRSANHGQKFLLEHGKISEDDARHLADLPETREALSCGFSFEETLGWSVKSFVNLCYDLFRWEEELRLPGGRSAARALPAESRRTRWSSRAWVSSGRPACRGRARRRGLRRGSRAAADARYLGPRRAQAARRVSARTDGRRGDRRLGRRERPTTALRLVCPAFSRFRAHRRHRLRQRISTQDRRSPSTRTSPNRPPRGARRALPPPAPDEFTLPAREGRGKLST
jgi:hypothetical protein